jgi:DNA helicase TIP49 (TBP-interacting protein)
MQLISTADIIKQRRKAEKVNKADMERAYSLFNDVTRCKAEMEKYEGWFINEVK